MCFNPAAAPVLAEDIPVNPQSLHSARASSARRLALTEYLTEAYPGKKQANSILVPTREGKDTAQAGGAMGPGLGGQDTSDTKHCLSPSPTHIRSEGEKQQGTAG